MSSVPPRLQTPFEQLLYHGYVAAERSGARSLQRHKWSPAPTGLASPLIPASLPLAPATRTANGAALLAQGRTRGEHSMNGPSWFDCSPRPPLSSSPGTRWDQRPGCPREPGRGSPGEEGGQGGGNTVLMGKERAQPWVNRSRPGLPGWPFTQQVGPQPAPGTSSDVETYLSGAPCLSALPHRRLS